MAISKVSRLKVLPPIIGPKDSKNSDSHRIRLTGAESGKSFRTNAIEKQNCGFNPKYMKNNESLTIISKVL